MSERGPGTVWCVWAKTNHGEMLAGTFLTENDAWNFGDTVEATRITCHVTPYSSQLWTAPQAGKVEP